MEIIKEKIRWTDALKTHFRKFRDVYFEYDYFDLFAKTYNVIPEAIFWEDKNLKIFWTHFIRNINHIKIYKNYNFYDLITPYGYGGPLINQKIEDINELRLSTRNFLEEYKKYALEEKYISEFIRFHPIFKNWELFEGLINIKYYNDIVAIDLTQPYEEICKNIEKKTRYYIRKAIKEFNIHQIIENPSMKEIEDFTMLYNKTMEKNYAEKKYYFSRKFIADHYKFDNLMITCRNQEEVIGACAIFLKGSFIMHYHLSATNYNFKNPPSRAVLWKAIKLAKEKGLKWFNFGGGVSNNDNLFHFKKGFSNTYLPFYIGNITFNTEVYDDLKLKNPLIQEDSSFFPVYRIGYDETLI